MKKSGKIEFVRPVVWVTGASSGIGMEVARQFARLGCNVCVSARRKRNLISLVDEIEVSGGNAFAFPLDITNLSRIESCSDQIFQKFGRIDVLVNNAGITSFKTISKIQMSEVVAILQTNLIGQIACVKSVLTRMTRQKGGTIFNIISMVAVKTYQNSGAYAASKAGMLGFGRVLREEVKGDNIRVVNVIPGATDTDIWAPKVREKHSARMMKARSVAEAIISVYQMPGDLVVDEITLRPVQGDL